MGRIAVRNISLWRTQVSLFGYLVIRLFGYSVIWLFGYLAWATRLTTCFVYSRDLLLLLTTALADVDDPDQMDPTTGLSPHMGEDDASLVSTLDGVAEALLAVVKARREELPDGTFILVIVRAIGLTTECVLCTGDVAGDLAAAKAAHAKALTPNDELIPAGGGCVGEAAALLLRSQERSVLERGMMWVIETIRASRQGGGGKGVKEGLQVPVRTDSPGLAQPIQGTPYGSVVYLPRRGPKSAGDKPDSPEDPGEQ